MATTSSTSTSTQVFKDNNNGNSETTRQEIKVAIAKAVELRALHASLMRGNSSANAKFPSLSPVSRSVSQFSAHDYPVFTPVRIPFFPSILIFLLNWVF
jgi:hypothetical protein